LGVVGGGAGGSFSNRSGSFNWQTGDSGNPNNTARGGGPNDNNPGGQDGGDGGNSDVASGGNGYLGAGRELQLGDTAFGISGGNGYGSGGSGGEFNSGSGGGGGYSGGGAGENANSGGGGASIRINGPASTGTISATEATRFPNHGFINYKFIEDLTPADPPTISCVPDQIVNITNAQAVTFTPADLDAGSSDPNGFPLTYQMCQQSFDGTYVCRDSKTWDCSDVGRTQPWVLAVSNGYQTSYCNVTIRVAEEVPEPICPFSGRVVINLDGSCSQTYTGAELEPTSPLDCAGTLPDVTLLLPDDTRTNPTDFFTNGYTFGDGITTVVYNAPSGQCAYAIEVRADPTVFGISCPNNQVVDLGSNNCSTTISAADLALDYSGPGAISYRIEPDVLGDAVEGTGQIPAHALDRGTTVFRYFVTEPGGCEAECAFSIRTNWESTAAVDFACQDATYPHSLFNLDFRAAAFAGVIRSEDNCGPSP
ncbi:MAG: hypothetical protein AAF597_15575, partial [Bacteroidota bacterium]